MLHNKWKQRKLERISGDNQRLEPIASGTNGRLEWLSAADASVLEGDIYINGVLLEDINT